MSILSVLGFFPLLNKSIFEGLRKFNNFYANSKEKKIFFLVLEGIFCFSFDEFCYQRTTEIFS